MNKALLDSKLESLIDLLQKLRQILNEHSKKTNVQEFLFYAAEKKAEEVVELGISINQELLKDKGKISLSYYDSFIDLKIFSIFNKEELTELAKTAGFRNRLAHDYLTIMPAVAIRTMQNMLKIYPKYAQKVKAISSK